MWRVSSLLLLLSMAHHCRQGPIGNICSTGHEKRVFAGLGESGILAAHDVVQGNATGFLEGCRAEIVTCPSCVIFLTFSYLNLSCHCGCGFSVFLCSPCRSDYVWVTEPSYEEASGVSFCGVHPGSGPQPKRLEYKSKIRAVRVSLFYSRSHTHAFTVEYRSEPNRQLFVGTSQYQLGNGFGSRFLSSPFFPAAYPRDIAVEYALVCKKHFTQFLPSDDDDFNCRIRLVFTDFQLAASSFIEFYEGGRRVHTVSGTSFRPPVIISATNFLTARFFASGQNDTGFKAFFSFVSEEVVREMTKSETDCGGFVGNVGGTIAMMNMTDSNLKLYYCIWLIQPGRNFLGVKSHLYLKVTAFWNFVGDAELQIRRGLTSESPLLESLRYPISQNFREHVIPVKYGSYISLRAFFGPSSYFAVAYAGFSFNKCFGASDFRCRNFRCISKKLTCDGYDHCGDSSDEPALCYQEGVLEPGGGKWRPRTPNYYFPKAKEISGSLVLLVSFAGLVFLGLFLGIAIYRIAARGRRQRELQDQLRAADDLRASFSDEVSVENIVIDAVDPPPSYEHPPDYEDVVKMAVAGSRFLKTERD